MSWVQRLKRVFKIDIESCPQCGGKLRVIACIEDPLVIRQILNHVNGIDTRSNRAARGPPKLHRGEHKLVSYLGRSGPGPDAAIRREMEHL